MDSSPLNHPNNAICSKNVTGASIQQKIDIVTIEGITCTKICWTEYMYISCMYTVLQEKELYPATEGLWELERGITYQCKLDENFPYQNTRNMFTPP